MKYAFTLVSGFFASSIGTFLMFPWIMQHYFLGSSNNALILVVMLTFMFALSLIMAYISGKLK